VKLKSCDKNVKRPDDGHIPTVPQTPSESEALADVKSSVVLLQELWKALTIRLLKKVQSGDEMSAEEYNVVMKHLVTNKTSLENLVSLHQIRMLEKLEQIIKAKDPIALEEPCKGQEHSKEQLDKLTQDLMSDFDGSVEYK
jgi:hypothetical protein